VIQAWPELQQWTAIFCLAMAWPESLQCTSSIGLADGLGMVSTSSLATAWPELKQIARQQSMMYWFNSGQAIARQQSMMYCFNSGHAIARQQSMMRALFQLRIID
jgi:hypothetical protein